MTRIIHPGVRRSLFEAATAVHYRGAPRTVINAQGAVVVGADLPPAPTIIGTIQPRSYLVGSGPYVIDLRTKFSGATGYLIPDLPILTLDGPVLTIDPTEVLAETEVEVRARNSGGSATISFALTTMLAPFSVTQPDPITMTAGDAVLIDLADYVTSTYEITFALASGQVPGAGFAGGVLDLTGAAVGAVAVVVTASDPYGRVETITVTGVIHEAEDEQQPEDPGIILTTNPDATITLTVTGPGELTVTVPTPPEYAGAYVFDADDFRADLASGPVALVPVAVTGDAVVGATLTATPALWLCAADAGPLAVTRQWHDGATPIPGATGLTYVRASSGEALRYIEPATDGNGTRTSIAEAEPAVEPGLLPDTFSAPDGTLLSAYVGESGIGWRTSDNRAVVEAGALRPINGPGGMRLQDRLDSIGADQWVEATMVVLGANERMGLGVRIGGDRDGDFVDMVPTVAWVRKIVAGVVTIVSNAIALTGLSDGSECQVRLEVQGTTLRLFVNGTQRWTGTDTSHATGRPGIAANGGIANRSGSYPATFHAGAI